MKYSALLTMAFAAVVAFAGCGGNDNPTEDIPLIDIPTGDTIDPNDTSESDVSRPDSETATDEGPCIAGFGFYGEMDNEAEGVHIVMSASQVRPIPIFYRDCEGDDENRAVSFELVDGQDFCSLDAASAFTNVSGIAEGSVRSKTRAGFCHVKACANGGTDTCVTVTVQVIPKDIPPLIIKSERSGTLLYSGVNMADVCLFKHSEGKPFPCDSMDWTNLPMADLCLNDQPLSDTIVIKNLLGLKEEKSQDYTIIGKGRVKDSTLIRSWACDDTTAHVEYGDQVEVILKYQDIPPSIKGSWDLDSNFDLTSGLPPTVDKILDILIGLFESPTGQILLMLCDETILGINLNEEICGYIFSDPVDPVLGEYGTIGTFVVSIIDQILVNLLVNNCPSETDPDLCKNIYFTGKDIGSMLQKFRILSTMNCKRDPKLDGIINLGDCTEEWHTVIFKWTMGKDCDPQAPECGEFPFNMRLIPDIGKTISADVSGALVNGTHLQIDPHPVNLKYGALINFALEKVLLPQVFGDGSDGLPRIDSYGALIGSLLAGRQCLQYDPTGLSCCNDFDATLTAKYTWLPAGLAGGACEALLTTAVDYIRSQLNSLDATPDNFRIGTPVDNPAPLFDTDDDMEFDALATQPQPADWDANLIVGSYTYDPIGKFFGTKN